MIENKKGGTMSTNEKTANEIIEELEAENERLRKRDAEMQAGIDRMSNILAGQSELDAKGDAAQNMRLRAENERLKMLLSMWWRNAFDKDFWMPKCAVEQTIKAIANNNKEEANARLIAAAPDMLDELMNYCAECMGNGADRCPFYNKDGEMCRMASNGTCDTWMTICLATGHDPATPWEVE